MRYTQVFASMVAPLVALAGTMVLAEPKAAPAAEPHSVTFLGVHFQNDNEMYEPTSDAERNRLAKTERIFKDKLTESGRFRFSDPDAALKSKIAAGQAPGECGGCEIEYGKQVGTEQIAWINVQKVSNLILNMNVYMADVGSNKMTFVRSVDIRSNSDESWERSINFLIKNYLLPGVS